MLVDRVHEKARHHELVPESQFIFEVPPPRNRLGLAPAGAFGGSEVRVGAFCAAVKINGQGTPEAEVLNNFSAERLERSIE